MLFFSVLAKRLLVVGLAASCVSIYSSMVTRRSYVRDPAHYAVLGYAKKAQTNPLQNSVRFVNIFNRLPAEIQLVQLRSFSPTDMLQLYEFMESIEQRLKGISDNAAVIDSDVLEPEDELRLFIDKDKKFTGMSLLGALVYEARARISKILGCTTDSLQKGTCMPLAKSNDEQLTPEQKAAHPFKELAKQGKLTPDYWVKLLPIVDIMDRWFKGATDLWKIYFIQDMQKLDNEPFGAITSYRIRNKMAGNRQADFTELIFDNQVPSVDITILPDMLPGPGSIASPPSAIANVYAATLPDNLVDAVLTSQVATRSPDTAIRVKYVLDDPYVRRQIDRFLHKVNQMPVAPVQVVVPEKTIDIDTKEVKSTDKPASLLEYYWARVVEKSTLV